MGISEELKEKIPAWAKLTEAEKTKKNRIYSKVYSCVANYLRDSQRFAEEVSAH